MQDLRLGVIGLGPRSGLADYAHLPDRGSRIVACCDIDPHILRAESARFGPDVIAVPDLDQLLDLDLDGVFVLTPDDTHEEISMRLLAAGVNVFLEKPMAITVEGCDRILETARKHRVRLYVGHNMRHMPVVQTLRGLIAQGTIGQVKAIWCRHFVGHGGDFYFKDWHADRTRTTGLLLQKGAHDLDVIHWLAGGVSRRVTALGGLSVYGDITDRTDRSGQRMPDWFDPDNNWPPASLTGLNPVVDVEDISMMLMQLDNGVLASYQQCHFTPDYWRNYTVIGTEGRMENFGDESGAQVRVWNRRSNYRAEADITVVVPPAPGTHGGADSELTAEFCAFLRDGVPTLTSPVAARDAVAAGYAATTSLRAAGRAVTIEPVPDAIGEYYAAGQPGAGRPAQCAGGMS